MGTNVNTKSFPPSSEAGLCKAYDDYLDDQRNEYGSDPYSGTFAAKIGDGLTCQGSKVFGSRDAAFAYLNDLELDKNGPSVAVRYVNGGQEPKRQPEDATLAQLRADLAGVPKTMIERARAAKSKTRGCQACGSSVATEWIGKTPASGPFYGPKTTCPICGDAGFLATTADTAKIARLTAAIAAHEAKAKAALAKTLAAAVKSAKPEDCAWLVCGACRS